MNYKIKKISGDASFREFYRLKKNNKTSIIVFAKKDKYKFHQLGKVLKKDLILGGWIGTMIGIMLTFGLVDNSVNNNFGDLLNSIGMAMITLLYGYMIGNIVESCWPGKE